MHPHKLLLFAILLISSFVRAENLVTNVAEMARLSDLGVSADVPFDVEAQLMSDCSSPHAYAFYIRDRAGSSALCVSWILQYVPVELGDWLHLKGSLIRHPDDLTYAVVSSISVLRHDEKPQPREATAEEIYCGKCSAAYVRVKGTVVDAFRDEANPAFSFIALACGGETIYCPSTILSDRQLDSLIDAKVTIQGICSSYRNRGPRAKLGYEINIDDPKDIVILEPAPKDPFNVPFLSGNVHNVFQPDRDKPIRRKVRGQVEAVWQKNKVLVRSENGELSTLELTKPIPPAYGMTIEAVGFPETDFYSLNLSHAFWKRTTGPELAAPDPLAITPERLLTDEEGRQHYKVELQGRPIRVTGLICSLPSSEEGDGIIHIRNGAFLIPVDASSVPAVLKDLEIGARIEATGVCILNTENWRPQAPFPHVKGVTLVLRTPRDIRVLARPSWWGTGRLLIVIGSLLAGLLAILFWCLSLRHLAHLRSRQLLSAQMAESTSRLRTEERTRLAVELHNTMSQDMTGVALEIATADRLLTTDAESARRHLEAAATTLKLCREELRHCLWDLQNSALEEKDITLAVRQTLAPHLGHARLSVRFTLADPALNDNIKHTLLRILRELVINAVCHGEATEISIVGSDKGDLLLVSVKDNGLGFEPLLAPSLTKGHYGLQGIRERVKRYNGTLEVDSSPGHGTKVDIALHKPSHQEHAS